VALAFDLRSVSRAFDGQPALEGVTAVLAAGQVTALVGPSGCGKTTLLRILGGLDIPTSGEVRVSGDAAPAAPAARPAIGFAFQEPRLLPWRTVRSNVALPLELAGVPRAERLARADRMIAMVGLAAATRKVPHQLSGGMRMRAAIARALVTNPRALLLDEPFGALDEITRSTLDDLLLSLRAELGMTVVMVTHSIVEAVYVADRVLVMAPGPGRVVADLRPGFAPRTAALRGTPEFAACTAQVLQAMAGAMASHAASPAACAAHRAARAGGHP
jgi:NitT/TauT family transport system ATP-binding protein